MIRQRDSVQRTTKRGVAIVHHMLGGVAVMRQKAKAALYMAQAVRRTPSLPTRLWRLMTRVAHWINPRSRFAEWSFNEWMSWQARDAGLTPALKAGILGTERRR